MRHLVGLEERRAQGPGVPPSALPFAPTMTTPETDTMTNHDDDATTEAATTHDDERPALALGAEGSLALKTDETITREQRRSRRKRPVRARTISVKRMTKREIELGRMLYPEIDYWKPRTRADCADIPRPCPYVSCKYHLFLDVQAKTGAIKLNFPDLEVEDMKESCSLDIADRGYTTLEDVGAFTNLTRERIRQLEVRAMAKVKAGAEMYALHDFVDEGPVGRRRLPIIAKSDDLDDEDEEETMDDDDEDLPKLAATSDARDKISED